MKDILQRKQKSWVTYFKIIFYLMNDPDKLIKKLKMISHPEGEYFSESFRDKNNNISLIYYLLKKDQKSH